MGWLFILQLLPPPQGTILHPPSLPEWIFQGRHGGWFIAVLIQKQGQTILCKMILKFISKNNNKYKETVVKTTAVGMGDGTRYWNDLTRVIRIFFSVYILYPQLILKNLHHRNKSSARAKINKCTRTFAAVLFVTVEKNWKQESTRRGWRSVYNTCKSNSDGLSPALCYPSQTLLQWTSLVTCFSALCKRFGRLDS